MTNTSDNKKERDAQTFMEFHYPEIKDLSKHFLTLVSGTLVFSITFSNSIVANQSKYSMQPVLLGLAWILFIIAFCGCGLGLYLIFIAGEQAKGALIYDYKSDYKTLSRRAYVFLDVAAFAYGIGLILLAVTGFMRFNLI